VTRHGSVKITLPRWGSKAEAIAFAQRQLPWITTQLQKRANQPLPWSAGTEIWLRGERVTINFDERQIRFGCETILYDGTSDLRSSVLAHLRQLAVTELAPRTFEFAAIHGLKVTRVTIRDQKTRWGSCSRRGAISLNWRLIQVPPSVTDYIIVHELMHLREMNHSARFWKHVESACPEYRDAERWLRKHARQFF
jgi:predicted metal-dependent hydrolase